MKRPLLHPLALARRAQFRAGTGISVFFALATAASAAQAAPTRTSPDCFAKGAYTHDGFFLYGGTGIGALFVDSDAAISNGFRQAVPSSASGLLFPTLDIAIGGTLRDPLLVIGARYVRADADPVIHALGESFTIPDFRIGFGELALFGRYYLDAHVGTHVGGSVGILGLYAGETQGSLTDDSYSGSQDQYGVGLSVEGGQDFWIMKQVSIGVSLRLAFARVSRDSNATFVFAPTLQGGLVFH